MPKFSLRLDGLTQARDTLNSLPEAFKDAAAVSIDDGTLIMLEQAIARAPVGSGRDPHPGQLKASLGRNVRDDGLQVSVGSGLYRAKFTEFGTNDTPAEPFLFPAFRVGARYIRQQMRDWAQEAGEAAKFNTKRGRRPKKVA